MATLVFCHGKESGPRGTKIRALQPLAEDRGWQVLAPDFRGLQDAEARVEHLVTACRKLAPPRLLVGSSMGGYVAIRASRILRPQALLLFAPAVGRPDYAHADPEPVAGQTEIVHGWRDRIIDPTEVFAWARRHAVTLHLVEDEHSLVDSLPLIKELTLRLLAECGD